MENATKLRLLYLYQYLVRHTDADHPVSTTQLIRFLKDQYQIDVNRNTLANDFKMLEKAGINIEVRLSRQNMYYYDGALFDIPELKILIDAVSASKFITKKKSNQLISKLLTLTAESHAAQLRRYTDVDHRVKSENESGYYIVDVLNEAIEKKCKVQFQYTNYSPRKQRILRHGGTFYTVSPYRLVWDGDYYYLIGFSETRGIIQNFRLDRIYRTPDLLPEQQAVPLPKGFKLEEYYKTVFRMFGANNPINIQLTCKSHAMNSVVDHFGMKVHVLDSCEEQFTIEAPVCLSPTFYRWVFGWNGDVKILAPQNAVDEYRAMCRRGLEETVSIPKET